MATQKKSAKKASRAPGRESVAAKTKSTSAPKKQTDSRAESAKKSAAKKPPVKKDAAVKKSVSAPASANSQNPPAENLSAGERKQLASQRMWELVQQKKQRATQRQSWQSIEHHDHPAPQGGQSGVTDQNSGASMPSEMPGHRDRGSS